MGPAVRPARYDLHLHTSRSDGRRDLSDVLGRCARGGLDVVAITDHDAFLPIPAGPVVAEGRTLLVLAAAELTVQLGGREWHLLCYFPGQAPDAVRALAESQQRARVARYEASRARIGVPGLPTAAALAETGVVSPTRHHLARALMAAGHARDVGDAFARHLRGCCPPMGPPMAEAASLVRAAGGVTSWAHPSVEDAVRWIADVAAAGVDGIEAIRPSASSRDRRTLRRVARDAGLFVTGGSDWHGWGEPDLGLFAVTAPEIADFVARVGGPIAVAC